MVKLDEFTAATRRARQRRAAGPIAIGARYDRRRDRIIVSLNTGLELAFPPHIAQGLEKATPADLTDIDAPDEYQRVAAGNAAFHPVDLLALCGLLERLIRRGDT